ncbi:MAG: hypothetical protein NTZ56_00125 [Acidobacteria bacterium]|nr:hypothetical protein [Acidobacteriota bacterium]
MVGTLEEELTDELLNLYEKWKEIGPAKNIFLRMVKPTADGRLYKGPVGTVRYLLEKEELTEGFVSLVQAGKLDWTVEALVLQPRWGQLFSDGERAIAAERIRRAESFGVPKADNLPARARSGLSKKTTLHHVTADDIREFVRVRYLLPTRSQGGQQFSVRAGDVEKQLGMRNSIAHVCASLRSRKFLDPNGLRLLNIEGPPSQTSTTVVFTYGFLDSARTGAPGVPKTFPQAQPAIQEKTLFEKMREMRGIAKDMYKRLGGGEAAWRAEREGWPE